jgi:hypothetical protein
MNSLYVIVAALATVALIGTVAAATLLQQSAFAVWNPGDGLPESPKGHGDDVSRKAIGDPGLVPGAATGHGDEVRDEVTGGR